MVSLAPDPLPITVIVVLRDVVEPNRVLIDVATKLIDVPSTVLDTFVPTVVDVFNLSASSVLTPTPVKALRTLTSAMVAVYPSVSNTVVAPR